MCELFFFSPLGKMFVKNNKALSEALYSSPWMLSCGSNEMVQKENIGVLYVTREDYKK